MVVPLQKGIMILISMTRNEDLFKMDLARFPSTVGTYCLFLGLKHPARLQIGRLGVFDFPAGPYLYLGSAFGPGGLSGRLKHHLSTPKRTHWHIDYLRQQAQIGAIGYSVSPDSLECEWSSKVACADKTFIPAPGFGASDCQRGCAAHLYGLSTQAGFTLAAGLLNDPPMIWVEISKIE